MSILLFVALDFSRAFTKPAADQTLCVAGTPSGRCGYELPEARQDFYAVVGQFKPVLASHNRFYPPDTLTRMDGKLVFCEENQAESEPPKETGVLPAILLRELARSLDLLGTADVHSRMRWVDRRWGCSRVSCQERETWGASVTPFPCSD